MDAKYTYEELHKKTVAQLREIAKDIEDEAVRGYSQLHKEQLLAAICKALGVETHEHHQVVGLDKRGIKAEIRQLRTQRDVAAQAHDREQLRSIRRRIHHLKHRLRRAMV